MTAKLHDLCHLRSDNPQGSTRWATPRYFALTIHGVELEMSVEEEIDL